MLEGSEKHHNTLHINDIEFKIVKGSDGNDYYIHYRLYENTVEHFIDCKLCTKKI